MKKFINGVLKIVGVVFAVVTSLVATVISGAFPEQLTLFETEFRRDVCIVMGKNCDSSLKSVISDEKYNEEFWDTIRGNFLISYNRSATILTCLKVYSM